MADRAQAPPGPWRGIFPILLTPFDHDGGLDIASLARQVDYCLERGVAGLVAPAVFGEFYTLSDVERSHVIRTICASAAGQAPVIAGVSGVSGHHARELALQAQELGATAFLAMPPYAGASLGADGVADYYGRIGEAVEGPIMVQNAGPPAGTPMPLDQVAALVRQIPDILLIKEEVVPTPHRIAALVDRLGCEVNGVFGGMGGVYFLEELERGASGTMPAPQFVEVFIDVHDAFRAGDIERARMVFGALLPALMAERLLGVPFAKEVLVRRGVLRTPVCRAGLPALDRLDHEYVDRLLERLSGALARPDAHTQEEIA
jgi:4-hydroxy-tetrahydrodipicolinate synthase